MSGEPASARPVNRESAREEAIEFVLELGRAMHVYGGSAAEVEHAMTTSARRLGIAGEFFATQTSIFASFRDDPAVTRSSSTHLMRVEPGSADLARRERVDSVLADVLEGGFDAREGRIVLAAIRSDPATYPRWLLVACSIVTSAGVARLFGLSPFEIVLAGCVGLVVCLLDLAAVRSRRLRRVFLPAAGFVAAAVVATASGLRGEPVAFQVIIAGVITCLPGLRLTTAMLELALDHLAAGTARLLGAVMTLIALSFGAALGAQVGDLFPDTSAFTAIDAARAESAQWTLYLALAVLPLCIGVFFNAARRDLVWILATCALSFFGTRLGARWLGEGFEAALAGLLVGLASNVYARLLDRPAVTTMLPGILLVVPGSLGFRSLFGLIERDVISGVDAAFQVTVVGMSIIGGLFVANVLIRPRRIDLSSG